MAAVDAHGPGGADQDVLVVVGQPDDFVGHHLADGEHQVEASFDDEAVYLGGPGVAQQTAGLLLYKGGRQLSQGDHVGAPVMDGEERVRDFSEHAGEDRRTHGAVGSQRGKDAAKVVAVVVVGVPGERAGLGVETGGVRRNGQDFVPGAYLIQRAVKSAAHGFQGELDIGSSQPAIEHVSLS